MLAPDSSPRIWRFVSPDSEILIRSCTLFLFLELTFPCTADWLKGGSTTCIPTYRGTIEDSRMLSIRHSNNSTLLLRLSRRSHLSKGGQEPADLRCPREQQPVGASPRFARCILRALRKKKKVHMILLLSYSARTFHSLNSLRLYPALIHSYRCNVNTGISSTSYYIQHCCGLAPVKSELLP
jgi:hypothetical protein